MFMANGRPKINIQYLKYRVPSWNWNVVVDGKDWRYVGSKINANNQEAEKVVVFFKIETFPSGDFDCAWFVGNGIIEQDFFVWAASQTKS